MKYLLAFLLVAATAILVTGDPYDRSVLEAMSLEEMERVALRLEALQPDEIERVALRLAQVQREVKELQRIHLTNVQRALKMLRSSNPNKIIVPLDRYNICDAKDTIEVIRRKIVLSVPGLFDSIVERIPE